MKVTTDLIRQCYLFLKQVHPFSNWELPPPGECEFGLLSGGHHAEYIRDGKHFIIVNPDTHIALNDLLMSVAHEMVHLRQELKGRLPEKGDGHNAEFRRLAKQVCASLGWDLQRF